MSPTQPETNLTLCQRIVESYRCAQAFQAHRNEAHSLAEEGVELAIQHQFLSTVEKSLATQFYDLCVEVVVAKPRGGLTTKEETVFVEKHRRLYKRKRDVAWTVTEYLAHQESWLGRTEANREVQRELTIRLGKLSREDANATFEALEEMALTSLETHRLVMEAKDITSRTEALHSTTRFLNEAGHSLLRFHGIEELAVEELMEKTGTSDVPNKE